VDIYIVDKEDKIQGGWFGKIDQELLANFLEELLNDYDIVSASDDEVRIIEKEKIGA
jgi:hypothetical protein